ncbi:hypothetical protein D3C78_1454040 [compost metagenome]
MSSTKWSVSPERKESKRAMVLKPEYCGSTATSSRSRAVRPRRSTRSGRLGITSLSLSMAPQIWRQALRTSSCCSGERNCARRYSTETRSPNMTLASRKREEKSWYAAGVRLAAPMRAWYRSIAWLITGVPL